MQGKKDTVQNETIEEQRKKASEAIYLFREAVFEALGINRFVEWLNNRLKDGKK